MLCSWTVDLNPKKTYEIEVTKRPTNGLVLTELAFEIITDGQLSCQLFGEEQFEPKLTIQGQQPDYSASKTLSSVESLTIYSRNLYKIQQSAFRIELREVSQSSATSLTTSIMLQLLAFVCFLSLLSFAKIAWHKRQKRQTCQQDENHHRMMMADYDRLIPKFIFKRGGCQEV